MRTVRLGAEFTRIDNADGDFVLIDPGPLERTGALQVSGGETVICIGGLSRFRDGKGRVAEAYRDITGAIFLEGRHIIMERTGDAVSGGGTPRKVATPTEFPDLYIQNFRIEGVRGARDRVHADGFQMDFSVNSINIDKLTVDTNYQVLFMRPEPGGGRVRSHIDLRRCNFRKNDIPGDSGPTKLVYFASDPEELSSAGHKIFLTEVWCDVPAGHDARDYVYPRVGSQLDSDSRGPFVWWPTLTQVIRDLRGDPGRIRIGTPPGGDFVPAASVGLGYTSPGYQEAFDLSGLL